MKKLSRIILGWYYWITNRNNKLAIYRLQECIRCDLYKRGVCTYCGCPVQAKSRIPEEECPHPEGNKWKTEFPVTASYDGKELFSGSIDLVSGEWKEK